MMSLGAKLGNGSQWARARLSRVSANSSFVKVIQDRDDSDQIFTQSRKSGRRSSRGKGGNNEESRIHVISDFDSESFDKESIVADVNLG